MKKKFLQRLLLFSAPWLILLLIPIFTGLWFGDFLPSSQIALLQAERDALYAPYGVRVDNFYYKLPVALNQRADFLVMGSSRFFYLRHDFVSNHDYRFYNASIPVLSPSESLGFLQVLAANDAMPELLILGLDLPQFNADRIYFRRSENAIEPAGLSQELARFNQAYKEISLAYILKPQVIFEAMNSQDNILGLAAFTTKGALLWRPDGSLAAETSPSANRIAFRGYEKNWQAHNGIFDEGATIDEEQIQAVRDIISLAQSHDTVIVTVLMPYHPDYYIRMNTSEDHQFFNLARGRIASLFDNSGMYFYDFTNPDDTLVDISMFRDAWHLGQAGSLAIYMQILADIPDVLSPYSDINSLQAFAETLN